MITKSRFCSFLYETRPHKEHSFIFRKLARTKKKPKTKWVTQERRIRFLVMICSMNLRF